MWVIYPALFLKVILHVVDMFLFFFRFLGQPKNKITEQAVLAAQVANYVDQFVKEFSMDDIQYVRSIRSAKNSIYNV